ncbi:hypothetical protein SPBR_01750 [Sporothrix brasiliensis 5110]|uniref:Uncharacterized protein n=1 Tax=Sporothrix brasiliensis 5110 TaxID=1398154 RepID=A0A0C2J1M2_9PEZI|nr:uncharacterized protein SPBR_01750 [Sporothrix brasiliensis 5110]KIH90997.1 hypothetical protein SPBR_01750 [Sporothrix brasiliensis 5110]
MAPLVPIAQETVYLVAAPTFHNHGDSLSNHANYTVRQLACDIDTGAIMSLLQLVAYGCLTQTQDDEEPSSTQHQASQTLSPEMHRPTQTWFWSVIQFEFVLLMLSSKQAPDAFLAMLALLRTSALPESIGPITNDPARDAGVVAAIVIDRISHHIEEPPKWAANSKYTEWDVRLAALGVLDCFAQSPFGRLSLAAGECTLPRIVGALVPAYGELRDRDLLDEPLHPSDDLLSLSESQIRAYGIGGFDLGQTLGLKKHSTALASTKVVGNVSSETLGAKSMLSRTPDGRDLGRSVTPLILLYVSSAVYLLHSILTDPYTAHVANMPAKLADTRGGLQGSYLLTMARLGFRIDPAFSTGLHEETYKLAMELFKLAATPLEEREYGEWAKKSQSLSSAAARSQTQQQEHNDPFCDDIVGDLTVIKIEKGAVP